MNKVKVGIFGGTGYTGWTLIQLLLAHPYVEITALASKSMAGKTLHDAYPTAPEIPLIDVEDIDFDSLDVVFLCLPHTQSAMIVEKGNATGIKVIDLSADLRLDTVEDYQTWYKVPHPAAHLLPTVYGLPEFYREQIAKENLVANPGCYATAMLLGLLPLAENDLITEDTQIIVDAKSGTSGAGRTPKQNTLFSEVHGNFSPYAIGRAHRHIGEVEQQLIKAGAGNQQIIFSPHLLPVDRGILAGIYIKVTDMNEAVTFIKSKYQDEPLVNVLPEGELATLVHVVRTPKAVISLTPSVHNTLIINVAIDNLLKGAASQAVQNFNLIFGFEETCALLHSNGGMY